MKNFCNRLAIVATVLGSLTACVTESTGGLPPPAPLEERVQAQLDLARGYLEQRDFVRAQPPLQKALEIDPRHVEAHVLIAVLFGVQSEKELAEFHYRTALRIDPDNAQALNNYGSFLYSQGRFADALQPLSRLVKDTTYRARSQAFENLGMAQLRLGQIDAAEASFERALDLNFRQPGAALELAEIAFARGDVELATARLLEFRSLARQNARSLCLNMKVAAHLEQQDLVASSALALKNLYPDVADQCLINPK